MPSQSSQESTPEQMSADQIRSQMQQYRLEMDSDVGKFVEDTQSLGDWQQYVKAKPLLTFAVCAVAGYMLIPKKNRYVQPDADQVARLVKRKKLVVAPPRYVKNDGMFSGLTGMATKLAVQAISGIVLQKLGAQTSKSDDVKE